MTRPDVLRRTPLVLIALALSVAMLLPLAAAAFSNGQPASLVLGHNDYTSSNSLLWQDLDKPGGVAVDPTTGNVFVADGGKHRVLRYPSQSAFESNLPPEAVLGQPNVYSTSSANTAQGFNLPLGLAVDGEGRLWVSDANNHRVLRFDNASSKPTGAPADGVLGQPNFTSSTRATTQQGFSSPVGLAVDGEGRLWVADLGNNRVLRFDNAAGKPDGGPADAVLGQSDFTSDTEGRTAQAMDTPSGISLDGEGRLWVADGLNYRVLRFDAVLSKPNGGPADGVLGQPDFTSRITMPLDRSTISWDLEADSGGRLWVVDLNRRVMRFDNAASKPNGAPADGVLGQPDLFSTTSALSAQGFREPNSVAIDAAGRLWVSDQNLIHRVMRFDNAASKPNGAPADGVLGIRHPDSALNPTARYFYVPVAVAIDPVSGKLFVADSGNNRVLRFGVPGSLTSGAPAEAVLGQTDVTGAYQATARGRMGDPSGLAFDSTGRLWVADTRNHRVLRFDNAASKPNGAPADGVLGQTGFTTRITATTREGMSSPVDVSVDASGTLWVADQDNRRVLRFDNAAAKPDGAPADGVLGQLNFTSSTAATTRQGLSRPSGIEADSAGHLWVADANNNRVLRFDNAAAKANGAPADGVLGQPNFTSSTAATTQEGLRSPANLTVDSAGRLWVPESGNNRVVMFAAAATKPDGGAADLVLGQPGFSSQTAATTQQGLSSPRNVAVDGGGRLWVADAFNNRVLMFESDEPTATVTTTPSETPTLTPSETPTLTPSETPTLTPTVTPSTTPSATPSTTPSLTPSLTPSITPSATPSTTPSATSSTTPSLTPSATPSLTPSVTPSVTPSLTPSATPSLTPSATPSLTPSTTPSTTPSATATVPAQPALQPRAYLPAVRR